MASRIMITPEELRDSSSKFTQKSGEVTEIINFLSNEVQSLESTWDGAAQDQFFIAFNEMKEVLKQFPEVLNGISAQLSMVAQTLEETDAALASQLKG